MNKKRLTFFTGGEDSFLRDIIINLRKDYEIKFFQRGGPDEFHQLMHDTDIAWIEWCDQLAEYATRSPKMCPQIVRLHSYEMFTDLPARVDWNKIDKLVFVSKVVHDYCLQKFNIRPDICTVIPNGVDVNKFQIPSNKSYNKKIVYTGYINYKKGPELLLQVFKKIHDYDKKFEFYIAGEHQDERIHLYFQTMAPRLPFQIHYDGWIRNMPDYLKDKDYVISSSLFESFQYSLAEGMAQGLVPLIHSWLGSDLIYPNELIWTWPEQAVDIIKNFENIKEKEQYRDKMRNHILNNFSLDMQIAQIKGLLNELDTNTHR